MNYNIVDLIFFLIEYILILFISMCSSLIKNLFVVMLYSAVYYVQLLQGTMLFYSSHTQLYRI